MLNSRSLYLHNRTKCLSSNVTARCSQFRGLLRSTNRPIYGHSSQLIDCDVFAELDKFHYCAIFSSPLGLRGHFLTHREIPCISRLALLFLRSFVLC